MSRLRCGRLDDHEPHPWSTPHSRARATNYVCPGGEAVMTKAERDAVRADASA